jgi:hypothetical protein
MDACVVGITVVIVALEDYIKPTSPKWHAVLRQGRLIRRVDQAFCRP